MFKGASAMIGTTPQNEKSQGSTGIGTSSQQKQQSSTGGAAIGGPSGGGQKQQPQSSIGKQAQQLAREYPFVLIWDNAQLQAGLMAYTQAKRAVQTTVIGQRVQTYTPLSQSVISSFQKALSLIYQAYKSSPWKDVPIDARNSSNYLVIVIKTLFDAFLNNIQSLKQTVIQTRALGKSYEPLLNQLNQQIAQYDKLAHETQKWIDKNWQTLYGPYQSSMRGLAFSIYAFILNNLASKPLTSLTPAIVTAAENYFKQANELWDANLTIPDFATPQAAFTALHTSFGTVEYNMFQNLLNSMRAEGDINSITDLIGSQNSNIRILNQAAPFLNKAAQAYSALEDSNSKSLYTAYEGMYNNIQNALKSLQQAQGLEDFQSQSTLINQASTQLAQAGVQWFWQHLNRALNLIEGRQTQKVGLEALSGFIAQQTGPIKNTQKILSQDSVIELPSLGTTFNNLSTACQTAASAYQASATFYNAAAQASAVPLSNGPLLSPQQQLSVTKALEIVTSNQILTTTAQATASLTQALTILSTQSSDAILKAQNLAIDALALTQQADAAYTQAQRAQGTTAVQSAFPFYALFPEGLTPFIGRYMGYYYEKLATALGDSKDLSTQALKADYYQAAFFYQNYLTPQAQSALLNNLKAFTTLVDSAQKALTVAQEKPDQSALWDQALSATLIVYTLWRLTQKSASFSQGPSLYESCLNGYKESAAFKQLSLSAQSIIYYRLFLLKKGETLQEDAAVLTLLEGLIQPFFAQAQSLLAEGLKPQLDNNTGYDKALTSLEKLATIEQQLATLALKSTQALKDQQAATPTSISKSLNLLLNTNEVYSSPLLNQLSPLNLAQVTPTQANLYQKQGDWAIQKASQALTTEPQAETMTECAIKTDFHGIAANAYAHAHALYLTLGNTSLAQTMLSLSDSEQFLAIADLVGDAPRPTLGTINAFSNTLGTTKVYAQYFLTPWIAQIPANLAVVPARLFQDFANYKKNPQLKQQVVEDLKDLAAALYLSQHVAAAGLTFTSYLDAIQNPAFNASDKTLAGLIADARNYRVQLGRWIDDGIEITKGVKVKTTLTFLKPPGRLPALVYCNLPVIPAPWGESTNQAFIPTAVLAYSFALRQYEGFQGTTSLQQVYAQTKKAQLEKSVQQAYLAQAYSLFQKALYMQGADIDESLIALFSTGQDEMDTLKAQRSFFKDFAKNTKTIVSLDTTNAQTSALLQASNIIQDYYSVAITYADAAATPGALTGNGLQAAQGAMGYLYELQGDFLKGCLVGQPTASQYQELLTFTLNLYKLSQGAYQQAGLVLNTQNVQLKTAALFESVGKTYYTLGYFISAIPFLNSAQQTYQNAAATYQQLGSNQAQAAQQKGLEMGLQALSSLFQGAIEFFVNWYTTRWSSPIALPSGQTVPSFEQLLADCNSFAYTDEESKLCSNIKESFLDSLIYLTSVDTTINQEAQSGGVTLSDPKTAATQKLTSTSTQGVQLDPTLQAYLDTHMPQGKDGKSISLAQALVTGALSAEQLKAVLNGLLLNGQTNIQALAQNKSALIPALSVTKLWADYIFQALAATYIQNYLSAVCSQGITQECIENQYGDLTDLMTGEANNIIAPAQQYVG